MTVRWVWVFLDLPEREFERSLAFWREVARSDVSPWRGQYREFATLLPAEGEPWLKVQRVGGEGGVHLDLDVDEPLPVAAERAVRLGAAVVGDLGDVVVCRSPGGFVFCLTPGPGRRRRARCARAPRACSTRSASTSHRGGMPPRSPSGPSSQGGRWTTPTPTTSSRASPGPRGCQCGSSCSGSPRVTGLRGHVDLSAVDRAAEVERHVGLGASEAGAGRGWTVMRAPAGHRYCVTDRHPGRSGPGAP